MSRRYKAGFVTSTEPSSSGTAYTGAAAGIWLKQRQMQAVQESLWPRAPGVPGAPTNVQASGGNAQATITFTAPDNGGLTITSYTVVASPGGNSASGSSSPITITGLTNGTSYTFTAYATNAAGNSPVSSASNSVIPTATIPTGQTLFSSAGTYTYYPPAGVSVVSAVAVGGGGGATFVGGGGGGLGWKNNIAVTPGQGYTVVVGSGGNGVFYTSTAGAGGNSYFINTSTVVGYGGAGGTSATNAVTGGTYVGDGGGNGGAVYSWIYNFAASGGGGAGGYTGNGGNGTGYATSNPQPNGLGGGGGGGGESPGGGAGGGGGVGLYGQGPDGYAGGGTWYKGGGGGSNGSAGQTMPDRTGYPGGSGGLYGGGGGGSDDEGPYGGNGSIGGVRIIHGSGRSFPSTNTGDL
jgi:hypothetical protein